MKVIILTQIIIKLPNRKLISYQLYKCRNNCLIRSSKHVIFGKLDSMDEIDMGLLIR